jgi:CubicO group peptidase (beta-lactamase class C family)
VWQDFAVIFSAAAILATLIAVDAKAVDALFTDYACPGCPGASVIVLHQGKVALVRAYGLADVDAGTRATPETNYRLASLTKQLTAMAVMVLAERGKLRYDDRVSDFLPGLPREIRLRHLLHHTSGIWDYEDFVPAESPRQVSDRDVATLLSRERRTHFAPGSAVRYSNSGYALLALVVERASGMRFAEFLRKHVFIPAGMQASVAYESGISTVPRRAFGYVAAPAGFRKRDQSPTSAVLGDGGVYSSVVDLAAWDRALDEHRLVGAAAQRLAWTAGSASSHYGFGWFVDDDRGRRRLSHHGETCGFTNAIVKYPDQRLTVIVLTNRAGGEPWTIAQRLADRWLGSATSASVAPPWPFLTTPNAH